MKSSCRNEKTFSFSVMTFAVVSHRKKYQKFKSSPPSFISKLMTFSRLYFFFFHCASCFDRILLYLFKLCKHKEGENLQEWALEGIENISFVNLSLSDDIFDTFSSSLCFPFPLCINSDPLETHAPKPKTFVTFFLSSAFCGRFFCHPRGQISGKRL